MQSFHQNGQVDSDFIEDRIVNEILPKFKNQETWIPHECDFEICDKKVELPVKISDIIDVKVYDLEGKLQWSGWKPLEVQNIQKANGINPIWSKGMFNVYGHNIQFYTDGYDGYNAKVQFYCFLRDEDGCIVVPEAYSGAITKYAAAEWLMTTGIQANMALANVYMQQARNQRNLQKGEANKQGEPQKRVTYAMTQVATYNTGARFIRQWRYYGGL